MIILILKSVTITQIMGSQRKSPQKATKSFGVWFVKIDPSQNQDLSTSLERPYKELLNACFSFEICHS